MKRKQYIYLFHRLYRSCAFYNLFPSNWSTLNSDSSHSQSSFSCNQKEKYYMNTGAIIRDGDLKREPFLVLGLSFWYGQIFPFLKQIAPLPEAHAFMLRGPLRMSRGENGVRNSRNLLCFWPTTQYVYVWNFAWVLGFNIKKFQ